MWDLCVPARRQRLVLVSWNLARAIVYPLIALLEDGVDGVSRMVRPFVKGTECRIRATMNVAHLAMVLLRKQKRALWIALRIACGPHGHHGGRVLRILPNPRDQGQFSRKRRMVVVCVSAKPRRRSLAVRPSLPLPQIASFLPGLLGRNAQFLVEEEHRGAAVSFKSSQRTVAHHARVLWT